MECLVHVLQIARLPASLAGKFGLEALLPSPRARQTSSADAGPGGGNIQYTLLSGPHKAHGEISCIISPLMQHAPAVRLELTSAPEDTQSAVLQVRLGRGALLATARPVRKRVDKVQWCELVTRTGATVGSVLVSFRPVASGATSTPKSPHPRPPARSSKRDSPQAREQKDGEEGLTRDALPVWVREVLGQLPSGPEMDATRVGHRLLDYAAIVTDSPQSWAPMRKRYSKFSPPRNNPQVLWRWPPPAPTMGGGLPSFSDSEDSDEESDGGGQLPSLPVSTTAARSHSNTSAHSGTGSTTGADGGACLVLSGDHGDLPFPDMLHWWVFGDAGQANRREPGSVFSFPLHTGTPHEDTVLWGVAMELPRPPAAGLAPCSPLTGVSRLRFVLLTRSQHVQALSTMLQDALSCDTRHLAAGNSPLWVVPRVTPVLAAPQASVEEHATRRGSVALHSSTGGIRTARPALQVRHQYSSSSDVLHSTPTPGGLAGHVPEAFATVDGQLESSIGTHLASRLRPPVLSSGVNALTGSRRGLRSPSPPEGGIQVKTNALGGVMFVAQSSAPSSPRGSRDGGSRRGSRSAFAGAAASAAGHDEDPLDGSGGGGAFQTPRFGNAPLYAPWGDSDGTHEHTTDADGGDASGAPDFEGPLHFRPPPLAEHWVRWLALGVPQPSTAAKLRVSLPLPHAMERYWASGSSGSGDNLPLPRVRVNDFLYLQPRPPGDFPLSPLGLQPLAAALSPKVILQGMECLLRERHVLVVGPCAQQVSAVTQGLAALLYPLRWALPHVPLLPKKILEQGDHLESPVPFLYGVTSHALQAAMQPVPAPDTAASRRRSARDVQLARLCDSPGAVAFLLGLSASPVMNVAGVTCSEMFAEMACPGRVRRGGRVATSPSARDHRSTAAAAACRDVEDMITAENRSDASDSDNSACGAEAQRLQMEGARGGAAAHVTRPARGDSVDTFARSSQWSSIGGGGSTSVCHAHVLDLSHGCFVRGGLRGWALQLAAERQWMPRPPHECECQLSPALPHSSEAARTAVRGVGRQNPLPVGYIAPLDRALGKAGGSGSSSPKRKPSAGSGDDEDAAFGVLATHTVASPTRRRQSIHTKLGDGTQNRAATSGPLSNSSTEQDAFPMGPASGAAQALVLPADAAGCVEGGSVPARRPPTVGSDWPTAFPKPLAEGFVRDMAHLSRAAVNRRGGARSFPWGPQHDRALQRLALRLMWHTLRGLHDATWVPGGASVAAARFAQTKRAELEWAQNTEHPSVASLPYIPRSRLASTALFLHRIAASQAMARFLEHHSGTHSRMAWLQLLQLACKSPPVQASTAQAATPPHTPEVNTTAAGGTRRRRLSIQLPGEETHANASVPGAAASPSPRTSPPLVLPAGDELWSPQAVPLPAGRQASNERRSSYEDASFVVRGFGSVRRGSDAAAAAAPTAAAGHLSYDVGAWLLEVARIAGDVPRPTPAMALSFSHWYVQLLHEEAAVRRSAQTAKLAPPSPSRKGGGTSDRPRAHVVPTCDWEASAAYLPALNGSIELGVVLTSDVVSGVLLRIQPPAYTAYVLPPVPVLGGSAASGASSAENVWSKHVYECLADHEAHAQMESLELVLTAPPPEASGTPPSYSERRAAWASIFRGLQHPAVWDQAVLQGLCTASQLVAATNGQSPHLLLELVAEGGVGAAVTPPNSTPPGFAGAMGTCMHSTLLSQPVPVAAAEGAIAEQLLRAGIYASVAGADCTPVYSAKTGNASSTTGHSPHDYAVSAQLPVEEMQTAEEPATSGAEYGVCVAVSADSLLDSTFTSAEVRSGHDELVLSALSAPIPCPHGPITVAQVLPSPWEVEQPMSVTVTGGDVVGNTPLVTPTAAALAAAARMHATDIALPVLAMSRHLVARQPAVRTLVTLLSAACAPARTALRQQMATDHGALPLRDSMGVLKTHLGAEQGGNEGGVPGDKPSPQQQARLSKSVQLRLKAQAARIRASAHFEGQDADDELPEIHPQTQAVSAGDPLGPRAAPLSGDLADAAMRAIESFASPQGRSAFVQMLQQHVLVLRGYSRPAACGAIPATARIGTGAAPIAPDPSVAGLASPPLQSPEWTSAASWITRHPTAHLLPELGPGVFGSSSVRSASHGSIKLWPPSAAALAVVSRVLLALSAAEGDYDTAAALLQVMRHFTTPLDGVWVAAAAASIRQGGGSASAGGAPAPSSSSNGAQHGMLGDGPDFASFKQLQESAKTCLHHAPWPVLLTHCCPQWRLQGGGAPPLSPLAAVLLGGTPRPGQGLCLQTALVAEASPATGAPQFWDAVMRSVFAEHMRGSAQDGQIETPPTGEALDVQSETLSSLFLEQLHPMVVAGAPRSVLAAWVAVLPLGEAQVISLEAALTQVTTAHTAQLVELLEGGVSRGGSDDDSEDQTVGPSSRTSPRRAGVRPRSATAAADMPPAGSDDSGEPSREGSPAPDGGGGDRTPDAATAFGLGRTEGGSSTPRVRRRASSAIARRIARDLLVPGADVSVAHTAISLHASSTDATSDATARGGVLALDVTVPAFSGVKEGSPIDGTPPPTGVKSPISPLSTNSPVGVALPSTPVTRDPLVGAPTSPWAANDAVAWWSHLRPEQDVLAGGTGVLTDRLQWLPLRSVMSALAQLRDAEGDGNGQQAGAILARSARPPAAPSPLLRGFGGARKRSSTDGAGTASALSSPGSDVASVAATAGQGTGTAAGGSIASPPGAGHRGEGGVLVDTPWRSHAPPLSPLDLQLLCHSVTLAESGTAVTVLARSSGGAAKLPQSSDDLPPTKLWSHCREVLLAGSSTGACVLWDVTRNTAVGAPWRPHKGGVTGAALLTLAASDAHDPLAPPSAYVVVTGGQGGGVCVGLHGAGNTEHSLFLGARLSESGGVATQRGVPPIIAAPQDGKGSFMERFAAGVTYLPDAPGTQATPTRRSSIGMRLKRMFKKKGATDSAPPAGALACCCLSARWLGPSGSEAAGDTITPPAAPGKPTLQVAAGFADGSIALWRVTLRVSKQSTNSTPAASPLSSAGGGQAGFSPGSSTTGGAAQNPTRWTGIASASGHAIGWTATAHPVMLCTGGHSADAPPQGIKLLTLARGTAPVVISWGRDGTLCIWCSQTGTLLNAWRAHTRAVVSSAAERSPYTGGGILATGSLDGSVHVWALTSSATTAVSRPSKHSSSDQPCLAAAIVTSVSVQHAAALTCHSPVWSVSLAHVSVCDRLVLVAGTDNGRVFAWAFRAVTPSATILGAWAARRTHTAAVTALDMHGPAGLVTSGSEDASVMLLDISRLLEMRGEAVTTGSMVSWEAPPVLPEDGGGEGTGYAACPVEAVWSTHDMEVDDERAEGNSGAGNGGVSRSSSQRSSRALRGFKACHMSQVAAVKLLPGAVASVSWDGTLRVWHALSSAVRDAATTHKAERAALQAEAAASTPDRKG